MVDIVKDCPACGGRVADSAKRCPHCGAVQKQKTSFFTWFMAGLGVLAIFIGLGAANNTTTSSERHRVPDNATRICAALKNAGASTCEVDFNVSEPNYIDATLNILNMQARTYCAEIVKTVSNKGISVHEPGRPWELRIFTPNSVRPVASCRLP
jgi:hypothetical protein